jgi:hypothetical protein
MIKTFQYNREFAVEYARRWAFSRNPLFYDFTGQGGNCTNFISQCLFAGTGQMNYTPTFGWYYNSVNNRAPSWTGVEYFYNFIIRNAKKGIGNGLGPFGQEVGPENIEPGDIIQLGMDNGDYYHTLLVTGFYQNTFLVAAQSDNAFNRKLNTYIYHKARYIHIDGYRAEKPNTLAKFEKLVSGKSL